jgi:hypothetical protein
MAEHKNGMNKIRITTMHNRNYGGFDYRSTSSGQAQANPLGIANVSEKPKINAY